MGGHTVKDIVSSGRGPRNEPRRHQLCHHHPLGRRPVDVLSFGTAIWTVFSGPSKKNAAKIDNLADKLASLDHRLGSIEQSQKVLPSKDDMHELELAMERLKGEMKTLSQVLHGQSALMERMEAIVGRTKNTF